MTPKKNSYALACLVVFFAACGPRVITVAVGRANAPVEMVAASLGVSCALLSGGVIKCWGSNWVGALGLGDTSSRGDKPADIGLPFPPVDLGTEKKAVSVHAAGTYIGPDDHACAILDDGQLKCWGYNEFGELGLGDTNNRGDGPGEMGDNLPAVNLGTASVVKQMALGTSCACALLDGGKVKCWGFNTEGSLGIGDATNRGAQPADMGDNLPAVDLGTGLTAVSVSAGVEHVCAVLGTGQLKCWGSNRLGELGLGDTNNRGDVPGEMGDNLPAVDLGAGRSAVSVVAGFFHTCALLDNGQVKCWGNNAEGALGLGDTNNRGDAPGEMGDNLAPVDLGTDRTAVAIAAAASSCAVLNTGEVKCWGKNEFGSLGLGLGDADNRGDAAGEMGDNLPSVPLGTQRRVVSIASGYDHNCVIFDTGELKCWGSNQAGQLGIGDATNRGDAPAQMGDALPTVNVGQ